MAATFIRITALFAATVFTTFATPSSSRGDDWATVLAKAKQEGIVVVHGGPGRTFEQVLVGAFVKAHPDIKVRFSGAPGSTEVPKILRERQAGIYDWDVYISGPTGVMASLKPAGALQPLQPILRKEIMDDANWVGGFAAGWMDNEKRYYYAFDGTVQFPVYVNWDVVPKSSITSLTDLLKPELSGKIVWHDPRTAGTGNGTSQTLLHNFGEENLIKLYKSKIVYTANDRQMAEWVVRGRYPIAIGLDTKELTEFQANGLGKNIAPLPESLFKAQQISVGFGGVVFMDRAPHPNAAAVYINWLLSKEGQEAYTRATRNSRRTDVAPGVAEQKPTPGKDYFLGQAENLTEERLRLQRLAKKAIDEN